MRRCRPKYCQKGGGAYFYPFPHRRVLKAINSAYLSKNALKEGQTSHLCYFQYKKCFIHCYDSVYSSKRVVRVLFGFWSFQIVFIVTDPCCSIDNHLVVIPCDFEDFITNSFATGPVFPKHKTLPLKYMGVNELLIHSNSMEDVKSNIETHTTRKRKHAQIWASSINNECLQLRSKILLILSLDGGKRHIDWTAPSVL